MNAIRCFGLVLLSILLSACDPAEPPTKPAKPVPATPAVQPPAVPPPVAQPPSIQPIAVPPAEPNKPAVAPKVASKPAPKLAKQPSTVPVEKTKLPKAQLDLRLPEELVERLEPESQTKGPLSEQILPPLFREKTAPKSPFQLNGRLITNDREDDYWRSVEGAEVQFEFKR